MKPSGAILYLCLGAAGPRKKIALIGTVFRPLSHSQHFMDRFLLGYAWDGQWRTPDVDLVSLYVDQFSQGDVSRARAKRHGVPISCGWNWSFQVP